MSGWAPWRTMRLRENIQSGHSTKTVDSRVRNNLEKEKRFEGREGRKLTAMNIHGFVLPFCFAYFCTIQNYFALFRIYLL